MGKFKVRSLVYIILLVVIMTMIFILSSQPAGKSLDLSDYIGDFLVNNVDDDIMSISKVPLFAGLNLRKYAHIILYVFLGSASYLFFYQIDRKKWTGRFMTRNVIKSIVVSAGYACLDEFHQLFIPGRTGLISDIFIDAIGFIPAVFITAIVMRFFKYKR